MPNFESLRTLLEKYFPESLDTQQWEQYEKAFAAYIEWNAQINVISRKDIENLAERHFLHSLAIAKLTPFLPGTKVLDVGTGGGFPGIPLAIFFPEVEFTLVDSVAKKIKVVQEIVQAAGLSNVQYSVQRVEQLKTQFDFAISRAVATMEEFLPWIHKRIHCRSRHTFENGVIYLRGGDVHAEMAPLIGGPLRYTAEKLTTIFQEEFFETKYLLHVTWCPPTTKKTITPL